MNTKLSLLISAATAVILLVMSGCSSSPSKPVPTTTVTYCDSYANWNKAVGEWNELTNLRDSTYGGDDVVVEGVHYPTYKDWAIANNKPTEMKDECNG